MTADQFNALAGEPPRNKDDDGLEIPPFMQKGYAPSRPRKNRKCVKPNYRAAVKPYVELALTGFALGVGFMLAVGLLSFLVG